MFIARDSSLSTFKRNQNKFTEIREPFLFPLPLTSSKQLSHSKWFSPQPCFSFSPEETLSKTPFTSNQRPRGAERGICHHPQDKSKGQGVWRLNGSAVLPLSAHNSRQRKELHSQQRTIPSGHWGKPSCLVHVLPPLNSPVLCPKL